MSTDQLVVELEHHLLAGVHDLLPPDDLRLLGGLLLTRLQLLPQLLLPRMGLSAHAVRSQAQGCQVEMGVGVRLRARRLFRPRASAASQ